MDAMTVAEPVARLNSPPCVACVSDCTESSCPAAEITPQCTEQCVVVACHDPFHDQINCHGPGLGHCDIVCDAAADCTDCTGFNDFLHCCTDYHSYFSEPKAYPWDSPNGDFSWDSSLDAFLCACGVQGSDPGIHPTNSSPAQNLNFLPSSDISSPDFSSGFSSPVQQDQSFMHHSISPCDSQSLLFDCQWGDCHEMFSGLSDLAEHVNRQHLHPTTSAIASGSTFNQHLQLTTSAIPSSSTSENSSQIQYNQVDNSQKSLSCLWANCNAYPALDFIPGQFPGVPPDVLGVLSNHLFQDHLGLQPGLSFPGYSNSQPNNVLLTRSTPPLPPDSVLNSASERGASPLHECSGTHLCRWQSCGMIFGSCDELTTHITDMHIGAGKAHYVCLWEGCTRHGDHGFSSKQKICRHLQTHTGHRPFQCKICRQNFSEAATLQQHMRRHTQEKPYQCDFPGCGKTFAITGALTIHKRTHNGHRPFKCTYCEKAFAESSNLSKHLRTHTGARPYACKEGGCGKTFARPDQLTRHMGVHRKKRDAGLQTDGGIPATA